MKRSKSEDAKERMPLLKGMQVDVEDLKRLSKSIDIEPTRSKNTFEEDEELVIDLVLAYNDNNKKNAESRNIFLNELIDTFGLELEGYEPNERTNEYESIKEESIKDSIKESIKDGLIKEESQIHFIKVHAPIEVLYDTAEGLEIKMPTKLNDINIRGWYEDIAAWKWLKKIDPFQIKNAETREPPNYFVATFSRQRLTEFVNHDQPDLFFTPVERSRLVYYLLENAKYGNEATDIGIQNLVHSGAILDAYPLHDGPILESKKDKPTNERQKLQKDWAMFSNMFRYQPIEPIREYFGEKVALYFAWLGFYTAFLIPASIVGILCFLYGVVVSLDAPTVIDACTDKLRPDGKGYLFYMCPLCDKACSYFLLSETCLSAKLIHCFDNEATIFFAVFMSIWATLFLEFWKRRQFSLAYGWHSLGFEEAEEHVRPEYVVTNTALKFNPVNHQYEPHMPKGVKARKMMGAFSVVVFFIILVLVAVLGVVIFRAALGAMLIASGSEKVRDSAGKIVPIAAGCLNLLAINLLKTVYNKIAVHLTEWECPRTQTDYEDSFTIKMFFFQFFNTYSSIIYIAFFKTENLTGSPGNYHRFTATGFRLPGCSAEGCFLALTIQLIIIMVGQQCINNVLEVLIPTISKWRKERKLKKKASAEEGIVHVKEPQWVDDFECEQQTKFSLFWEYLEIVLQYGFVTMFVTGFPLAPVFALLNNIIEIRVDAFNYINNFRRPVAQRAEDIGAWYSILATLTSVSVLINACLLAFTSELIPKLVYLHRDSPNGTMHGFLDWSLSTFNVKDFSNLSRPLDALAEGLPVQDTCRYPGYHDATFPYHRNLTNYMILSVRLTFLLSFIIFVLSVSWAIGYMVPDVPERVDLKMKRESFLSDEANKEHRKKWKMQKMSKRRMTMC